MNEKYVTLPTATTLPHGDFLMILDTEFIRTEEGCIVYDLGYVVINRITGEIVCKRGFVINDAVNLFKSQVYSNKYRYKNAFLPCYYKKNKKYYKNNPDYSKVSFREAIADIVKTMEAFKIDFFGAYNCYVDINALIDTSNYFKVSIPFKKTVINEVLKRTNKNVYIEYDAFDIYKPSKEILLKNNNYIRFITEAGLLTENNNIQTSAEAVFAYLIKDKKHKEKHNGLSDAMEEAFIAHWLNAQGVQFEKKVSKISVKI